MLISAPVNEIPFKLRVPVVINPYGILNVIEPVIPDRLTAAPPVAVIVCPTVIAVDPVKVTVPVPPAGGLMFQVAT
jgi:hypothetical protein